MLFEGFIIFGGMLWNVLLILLILTIISVYGIAIVKLVCYIKTQKRVDRLEHTVGDLSQKLTEIMKDTNESNDGNLQ
jgi:hypothetical protein